MNRRQIIEQYSGLAAVLVLVAVIAGGIARTELTFFDPRFFSFLWTTSYQPYFSFGLIIAALLILNFYRFVIREFVVTWPAKLSMAGSLGGLLITALVAFNPKGNIDYIHTGGALLLLLSSCGLLAWFSWDNKHTRAGRISLFLLVAGISLILLAVPLLLRANAPTIIEPIGLLILSLWVLALSSWR